jgi:hypothetical protein
MITHHVELFVPGVDLHKDDDGGDEEGDDDDHLAHIHDFLLENALKKNTDPEEKEKKRRRRSDGGYGECECDK